MYLPQNKDGCLSDMTDEELWRAVQQTDCRASFAQLFYRYWKTMFTTMISYTSDKEKCEEIIHDIFISVWQNRKKVQIRHFQHYVKAATRYQVVEFLKSKKRSKLLYSADWELHGHRSDYNEGESKVDLEDIKTYINWLIQDLPLRCQEIFILSRIDNLSNSEIAEKLDISKRTVENQITVALRHLRNGLGPLMGSILLMIIFS